MDIRWSEKLAETLMEREDLFKGSLDYSDTLAAKALIEVYRRTDDGRIYKRIKKYAEKLAHITDIKGHIGTDCKMLGSAAVFPYIYKVTGIPELKRASHIAFDLVKAREKTAEGIYFAQEGTEYISSDAVCYIGTFAAEHISSFKYIKKYSDIIRQFMTAYNNLLDCESGLIFPIYDRKKSIKCVEEATGHPPCISGHSLGRFVMSLADFIFHLDYRQPAVKSLSEILESLLKAALKYKLDNDCFAVIPNEADRGGCYAESCTTAMLLYAMARAVNKGMIFSTEISRAAGLIYEGIPDAFITVSKNGSLNIHKTCQEPGFADDLSYSAYMNRSIVSGDKETLAILILAAAEYESMRRKVF